MKRNGMCALCYLKKIFVKPPKAKDILPAKAYDNGAASTPPMGWSSWNTFRNNIDQEMIYDTALAMKNSGLSSAGYQYINIDDNWASSMRDDNGCLEGDLTRFSEGIAALVAKINALDLKVGIYSSNGTLTCEDLPASLNNEKRDAKTIASWGIEYFKYDFCHNEPISKYAPLVYGITISRVGERKELFYPAKDASLTGYAKFMKNASIPTGIMVAGLDGNSGTIKFDNVLANDNGEYILTIDIAKKGQYKKFLIAEVNEEDHYNIDIPSQAIWNHTARFQTKIYLSKGQNTICLYNPIRNKIDSAILQYRYMAKCLKAAAMNRAEETGEYKPIVFSICEWGFRKPWIWGKSAGNLWRTTPDIRPVWPWIMTIYERNVKLQNFSAKGGWNDPDMLEVGNGNLTKDENIAHFATWCMMNSPLILGNDLRKITPEILEIVTNKNLIAINQDSLCIQAKRIKMGKADILVKPLENNKIAVCFLNKFGGDKKISLDIQNLKKELYLADIDFKDDFEILDVLENTIEQTNRIVAKVRKHAVKVFILKSRIS